MTTTKRFFKTLSLRKTVSFSLLALAFSSIGYYAAISLLDLSTLPLIVAVSATTGIIAASLFGKDGSAEVEMLLQPFFSALQNNRMKRENAATANEFAQAYRDGRLKQHIQETQGRDIGYTTAKRRRR